MNDRYDYCPDVDGTWAVIDLATGQPAFFGGQPVMMVDLGRAEAITLLLNRSDTARVDGVLRPDGESRAEPQRPGGAEPRALGPD